MAVRKERVMSYLKIALGCMIGGIAYPLFMVPNGIVPGGLTGASMILHHLFAWPVGMTSMLLNIPLFALSLRSVGGRFAVRSFIAMCLFSLVIDLVPLECLTDDLLLASVFGGILLGIGLGLILSGNATTGGTDMIAKLLHKRFPFLSISTLLFAADFIVIAAAGICFDALHAMYAMICIFVSAKVIDGMLTGVNTAKACYVISATSEQVARRIMDELERGVTVLTARGAYSRDERPVLLCVATPSEIHRIKEIVRQEDASAFVFVTGASEVLGEGFGSLTE